MSNGELREQLDRAHLVESPDAWTRGFLDSPPDPVRYDNLNCDPDEVIMKIAELVPQGARVLDVGCGTGGLAQVLKERRDSHVVGIEPDAARASIARGRGMEVHQCYLTEESPADLGAFDVVILADVLEHISDPHKVVLAARRLLKNDGKMLISVPNIAHWSVRLSLLKGRFEYEPCGIMDATHVRWFTCATIAKFLERLSFDVTSIRYTIGAGLPAYERRALWKLLGWRWRKRIIRILVRLFPRLFACQVIVEANPRSAN